MVPRGSDERAVGDFLSASLEKVGGCTAGPGPAVVSVYINPDKGFAFVEFRTVAEASNAMALDGAVFAGVPLKIRRPNDYNPAAASALGPQVPAPGLNLRAVGLAPPGAPDPRLFIEGLPPYLEEAQCKELLSQFGAVESLELLRDPATGASQGCGFFIYEDDAVGDAACQGLNGLKMGDGVLQVRRAPGRPAHPPMPMMPGGMMGGPPPPGFPPGPGPPGIMGGPPPPHFGGAPAPGVGGAGAGFGGTRVVSLTNCVTPEDLADPEELEGIREDMQEEGAKYGPLLKVVIPQGPPAGSGGALPPGYLKVFLQYGDVAAAGRARQAMAGRKFGGKVVEAVFVDEEMFRQGAL